VVTGQASSLGEMTPLTSCLVSRKSLDANSDLPGHPGLACDPPENPSRRVSCVWAQTLPIDPKG
jgi:hypothetical protein